MMQVRSLILPSLTALFACLFLHPVMQAAAEDLNTIEQRVIGKWVHYRDTPNGRYTTIKDHDGQRTVLTMLDPQQHVVYSHSSEYTIEFENQVCIFTYRNHEVLIGPNAGTVTKDPVSYIFRIDGNRFLELHGMLSSDTGNPRLTVWEKLGDDAGS